MKTFSITLVIIAITILSINDIFSQTTISNYISASNFTLVGKIFSTKNIYHRIDTVDYPTLPPAVKRLLTNSAGLAISFKTNSTAISAKWSTSSRKPSANMTAIAFEGLDLYIKKDGKWQFAGVGKPNGNTTDTNLVKNMNNGEKECLLYLPLYDETTNLEIGIDSGAMIKASPDPFQKRILIYGSSILQGASASRPGMAYPARLSRETGLNFLNLGLSGSAKMEKAVVDMIAPITADAFILDCVPNSSPKEITERTAYMINTIQKHHPKTPIIVIQSIVRENGSFDQSIGQKVKEQNKNIKQEIEKLQQAGVKDLYLILDTNLLGDDHEGSVDGTHPNDLGFDRMLQQLKPQIMDILKKYDVQNKE